jgi:membrane protease YdiL (CAAX protease family)
MPRWRWAVHLLILGAYPVSLGVLALAMKREGSSQGPMLSSEFGKLMATMLGEMVVFGVFFLFAWLASRITAGDLRLRMRSIPRVLGEGFLYSVGLRLLVMVFMLIVVVVTVATGGGTEHSLQSLRPETEQLVDIQALVDNPLYLWTNLTLVSFVIAGFREELWRAGVLAGLAAFFPALTRSWKGQGLAIGLTAILFGLGHLPQGLGGVVSTTILGLGLGVIMVWRQSIWEAVIAHGFFNASTFAMLYFIQRYFPEALSGG